MDKWNKFYIEKNIQDFELLLHLFSKKIIGNVKFNVKEFKSFLSNKIENEEFNYILANYLEPNLKNDLSDKKKLNKEKIEEILKALDSYYLEIYKQILKTTIYGSSNFIGFKKIIENGTIRDDLKYFSLKEIKLLESLKNNNLTNEQLGKKIILFDKEDKSNLKHFFNKIKKGMINLSFISILILNITGCGINSNKNNYSDYNDSNKAYIFDSNISNFENDNYKINENKNTSNVNQNDYNIQNKKNESNDNLNESNSKKSSEINQKNKSLNQIIQENNKLENYFKNLIKSKDIKSSKLNKTYLKFQLKTINKKYENNQIKKNKLLNKIYNLIENGNYNAILEQIGTKLNLFNSIYSQNEIVLLQKLKITYPEISSDNYEDLDNFNKILNENLLDLKENLFKIINSYSKNSKLIKYLLEKNKDEYKNDFIKTIKFYSKLTTSSILEASKILESYTLEDYPDKDKYFEQIYKDLMSNNLNHIYDYIVSNVNNDNLNRIYSIIKKFKNPHFNKTIIRLLSLKYKLSDYTRINEIYIKIYNLVNQNHNYLFEKLLLDEFITDKNFTFERYISYLKILTILEYENYYYDYYKDLNNIILIEPKSINSLYILLDKFSNSDLSDFYRRKIKYVSNILKSQIKINPFYLMLNKDKFEILTEMIKNYSRYFGSKPISLNFENNQEIFEKITSDIQDKLNNFTKLKPETFLNYINKLSDEEFKILIQILYSNYYNLTLLIWNSRSKNIKSLYNSKLFDKSSYILDSWVENQEDLNLTTVEKKINIAFYLNSRNLKINRNNVDLAISDINSLYQKYKDENLFENRTIITFFTDEKYPNSDIYLFGNKRLRGKLKQLGSNVNFVSEIEFPNKDDRKEAFTNYILNATNKITILTGVHGTGDEIYYSNGITDVLKSKEFAKILKKKNDSGYNLENIIIILDQCYAATYSIEVLNELKKLGVDSYPLFINAEEFGQKGFVTKSTEYDSYFLNFLLSRIKLKDIIVNLYQLKEYLGNNPSLFTAKNYGRYNDKEYKALVKLF